jgi:signal transduction histidine kinase
MGTYEITIYRAVVLSAVLLGLIILAFGIAVVRSQRRLFEKSRRAYEAEIAFLKEKNRIAQDLHDELGPVLAATRMQVEQIGALTTGAEALVQGAEENLQAMLLRLRGIVENLLPAELLHNGLESLIRQHLEQCQSLYGVPFTLSYDVRTTLLLEKTQHLNAMVKELVHNAIRHGKAKAIELRLQERGKQLHLHFQDHGTGFDPAKGQQRGRGLHGLRDRTQLLGGQMEVFSKEGSGSIFYFQIPI